MAESTMSDASSRTLQRFNDAKTNLTKAVGRLLSTLEKTVACMVPDADSTEAVGKLDNGKEAAKIKGVIAKVEAVHEAVQRDTMKVVFVGRTSTGKSTTINAMLHSKILPSGIGHTTNCFCRVHGVGESKPFLITANSEQRQSIESVKQLAHALYPDEAVTLQSFVDVYWPRNRCSLLFHGVEIIDSPGLDLSKDHDGWIDEYCTDADVFVLVANSESSLNMTEKGFFRRVGEKLSTPNLFLLFNRWDCVDDEEDEDDATPIDRVREQHMGSCRELLVDQVGLADATNIEDRVFFVSSKEVLKARSRSVEPGDSGIQLGSDSQPSSRASSRSASTTSLSESASIRHREFERFESLFEECISSSAIRTRFKAHADTGCKLTVQVSDILTAVISQRKAQRIRLDECIQAKIQHLTHLGSKRAFEQSKCHQRVQTATDEARDKIMRIFENESKRNISRAVMKFQDRHNVFSVEDPAEYTRQLTATIEEQLADGLTARCSDELQRSFNTMNSALNKSVRALLPPDVHVEQLLPPSQYNSGFALDSTGLTEAFEPDLKFQFTLGAMTSSLFQTLLFPNEFKFKSSVQSGSNESPTTLQTAVHALDIATSILQSPVGAAGVTFATIIFQRPWISKLIAYPLALYGALYLFEWSQYDARAQKHRLHKQLINHVTTEVRILSKHSSFNFAQNLSNHLTDRTANLFAEAKRIEESLAESIEVTRMEVQVQVAALDAMEQIHDELKHQLNEFGTITQRIENAGRD